MDCQAESARAAKEVALIERALRAIHEKHRALNNLTAAADERLEHMTRQMEEVGTEMREQFGQKRIKTSESSGEGEGRERLLSALAQLRRDRKALEDLLNEKRMQISAGQSLGDKLTLELDSAQHTNDELESMRTTLEPQVLHLRREAEEKAMVLERTLAESARRQRAFDEREVLLQSKVNKQDSEMQLRVGRLDALQLRAEYIESKVSEHKDRLAGLAEARSLNQQLKSRFSRHAQEFEVRQAELRGKIKEENMLKREAEKEIGELQQAIRFLEEERLGVEQAPAVSSQAIPDLERQLQNSHKNIEMYEAQVKTVNAKVKDFSHLMDRLIEENQSLKKLLDDRREAKARLAFHDIGNARQSGVSVASSHYLSKSPGL